MTGFPVIPGRGGLLSPSALEVRYERSFITDLKLISASRVRDRIRKFVFSDFFETKHLQYLPDFRPMGATQIFYRFTLEEHLICIEVTGQIIKFVRVLPKPDV
jgi:hypothetical protein